MIPRLRLILLLAVTLLVPALPAHAQERVTPGGPRLDQAAAAFRRQVEPAADSASAMQARRATGRPMALMIVGGAALVLGMVIGSDIGTLFSVAGAVAFLYGLYLYLR